MPISPIRIVSGYPPESKLSSLILGRLAYRNRDRSHCSRRSVAHYNTDPKCRARNRKMFRQG